MKANPRSVAIVLGLLLCCTTNASAVDQGAVNKAIDNGVAALRKMQQRDGTWPHQHVGATALAALTLLECGAPKTDSAVLQAVEACRRESVQLRHTYSIALCILLFDRLGDAGDVPLIESLTVRLLAGQNAQGGWSYHCPAISASEVRRLARVIQQKSELRTGNTILAPERSRGTRTVGDLSAEIRQQLIQVQRQKASVTSRTKGPSRDDNSNTQFAILGLWVARRHGLPVTNAIGAFERRFRATQNPDGGWGYRLSTGKEKNLKQRLRGPAKSRDTMTCAGLLGLAVSHGAANEILEKAGKNKRSVAKDRALRVGLLALSTTIGHPQRGVQPAIPRVSGRTYYFLWSLERVAVALGLRTIGKKDWYEWGAQILLSNQNPNGTWQGQFGKGGADTCFALLFLKRANLTSDLTPQFRGVIRDPGTVELKQGGVGGAALLRLKKGDVSSALDPDSDVEIEQDREPPKDEQTIIRAASDDPASKLSARLLESKGTDQSRLIQQLRDNKGGQNTSALAMSIPLLSGNVKSRARQALAERLTRMTSKTLSRYLKTDDAEIRRAVVVASAMKDARALIPEMIELLDDPDPAVAAATLGALKAMTKQDFGPAADATADEKSRAVARWQAWWRRQ